MEGNGAGALLPVSDFTNWVEGKQFIEIQDIRREIVCWGKWRTLWDVVRDVAEGPTWLLVCVPSSDPLCTPEPRQPKNYISPYKSTWFWAISQLQPHESWVQNGGSRAQSTLSVDANPAGVRACGSSNADHLLPGGCCRAKPIAGTGFRFPSFLLWQR